MSKKKTETFTDNYKKLGEIVDFLQANEEPDIDKLVPMIQDASSAYKVCKARLDSVKTALDQHFKSDLKETIEGEDLAN